jgi:hypothetical protein
MIFQSHIPSIPLNYYVESIFYDEIYSGAKETFHPIHEKLMKEIKKFGEFEIAPKKGYVSLRRKKTICNDRAKN